MYSGCFVLVRARLPHPGTGPTPGEVEAVSGKGEGVSR